jgi:small subunit ribosomal protein S3
MGQKVNPIGLRLGINRTWDSAGSQQGRIRQAAARGHEDPRVLMKELKQAAVSKIVIERPHKKCRVTDHSARPGVVIGKKGADIDKLRKKVAEDDRTPKSSPQHRRSAQAGNRRDAGRRFDRAAARAPRGVPPRHEARVQSAMRLGAEGIRINCSGRLGGAEIARMEWYREGRVPLHTLRADIDYGVATAQTAYGICGVKVWIFKGEILEHDPMAQDKKMAEGSFGRWRRRAPASRRDRDAA